MSLFAPIETKAKKAALFGRLFDKREQTAKKTANPGPMPAQVGRYFATSERLVAATSGFRRC